MKNSYSAGRTQVHGLTSAVLPSLSGGMKRREKKQKDGRKRGERRGEKRKVKRKTYTKRISRKEEKLLKKSELAERGGG